MKECPKISVILATHNRVQYLDKALTALFENDYPNMEVVVVDGASTDGTVELLESHKGKITRWVSEPDSGEYDAYNKALSMTTGEIIKPMSDDDILLPGIFEYAASYFLQHPDVAVLFGHTLVFDDRSNHGFLIQDTLQVVQSGPISMRRLLCDTKIFNLSVSAFISSRVLNQVGKFDTSLTCGDTEMWVRIASKGLRLAIADRHFVHYHINPVGGIERKRWRLAWDHWLIARRYGSVPEQVFVFSTRLLLPMLLLPLQKIAHALGWHPLRMRAVRKARKATE